jgi:Divergent InlB B-repeat domain
MRMRRLSAILLMLVVVLPADALAAMNEIPVRTTKASENAPAADTGYVAWAEWTGREWNAYVKPEGGSRFQVDRPRWNAWMGGIDGDTLVYQEYRGNNRTWVAEGKGTSDLRLYDLIGRTRSNPPAGVNTGAWEYWPSIDGDWLLFGRATRRVVKVILFDMVSGTSRTLLRHRTGQKSWGTGGQVNGDYAVFDACNPRGTICNVYRYDTGADTTTKIPSAADWQFGPSVSSDGTMYFWRSANHCLPRTKLVRYSPSGDQQVLAAMPREFIGIDTYVSQEADGTLEVFYDRYDACGRRAGPGDVYKVNDSFALWITTGGTGTGVVTSDPAGIDCGSDCTQVYGGGTSVTLMAAAESGSTFVGWTGSCTGTGPCVLTLIEDHAVTATFDTS